MSKNLSKTVKVTAFVPFQKKKYLAIGVRSSTPVIDFFPCMKQYNVYTKKDFSDIFFGGAPQKKQERYEVNEPYVHSIVFSIPKSVNGFAWGERKDSPYITSVTSLFKRTIGRNKPNKTYEFNLRLYFGEFGKKQNPKIYST